MISMVNVIISYFMLSLKAVLCVYIFVLLFGDSDGCLKVNICPFFLISLD
jgi:hypothetical protein